MPSLKKMNFPQFIENINSFLEEVQCNQISAVYKKDNENQKNKSNKLEFDLIQDLQIYCFIQILKLKFPKKEFEINNGFWVKFLQVTQLNKDQSYNNDELIQSIDNRWNQYLSLIKTENEWSQIQHTIELIKQKRVIENKFFLNFENNQLTAIYESEKKQPEDAQKQKEQQQDSVKEKKIQINGHQENRSEMSSPRLSQEKTEQKKQINNKRSQPRMCQSRKSAPIGFGKKNKKNVNSNEEETTSESEKNDSQKEVQIEQQSQEPEQKQDEPSQKQGVQKENLDQQTIQNESESTLDSQNLPQNENSQNSLENNQKDVQLESFKNLTSERESISNEAPEQIFDQTEQQIITDDKQSIAFETQENVENNQLNYEPVEQEDQNSLQSQQQQQQIQQDENDNNIIIQEPQLEDEKDQQDREKEKNIIIDTASPTKRSSEDEDNDYQDAITKKVKRVSFNEKIDVHRIEKINDNLLINNNSQQSKDFNQFTAYQKNKEQQFVIIDDGNENKQEKEVVNTQYLQIVQRFFDSAQQLQDYLHKDKQCVSQVNTIQFLRKASMLGFNFDLYQNYLNLLLEKKDLQANELLWHPVEDYNLVFVLNNPYRPESKDKKARILEKKNRILIKQRCEYLDVKMSQYF